MESITEKKCKKCGEVKPLSAFPPNKDCQNGVMPKCRKCQKAHDRQRGYTASPDSTHKCSDCGIEKPVSEFSPDPRHPSGIQRKCKMCSAAWMREYRKANPDLIREGKREYEKTHRHVINACSKRTYHSNPERHRNNVQRWIDKNIEQVKEAARLWRVNNPDKVRAFAWNRRKKVYNAEGDGVTGEQWKELKESYFDRCIYCLRKVKIELDHVVSLASGGSNDIENAAPACHRCNARKNTKTLISFLYRELHRND